MPRNKSHRARTAKKRGRPKTKGIRGPRRGDEDLKEQIFAIAERIIADRGLSDFTLTDIGKAAKVHPSMVTYYFGGKKGLTETVLEAQLRKAENFFSPLDQLGDIPEEEILRQVFWQITRGLTQDDQRHHYKIMTQVMAADDPAAQEVGKRISSPLIRALAAIFEKIHPKASEAECEARAAILVGFSNLWSYFYWQFLPLLDVKTPSDELVEEYYALLEHMVLDCLIARHEGTRREYGKTRPDRISEPAESE